MGVFIEELNTVCDGSYASKCSLVLSCFASVVEGKQTYTNRISIADAKLTFLRFHTQRLTVATDNITKNVQDCIQEAVAKHDFHKRDITELFNKFLIRHGSVTKRIMNTINAGDEILSKLTSKWTSLSNLCIAKSFPWSRTDALLWWELAENENFDRTRKLLVQKQLRVQPVHLDPERALSLGIKGLEPEEMVTRVRESIPLCNVFQDGLSNLSSEDQFLFNRSVGSHSYVIPEVKFTCQGWIVKPGVTYSGTVFLADGIYFKGNKETMEWSKKYNTNSETVVRVDFKSIRKIKSMKHQLNDVALELHKYDKTSLFFVFDNIADRNAVEKFVKDSTMLPYPPTLKEALAYATLEWKERRMSNFDYLMTLNSLAGRTYNDLSQYPVFPYVLANYSEEQLNLGSEKSFRDLSRPLASQTLERQNFFKEKYEVNKANDPSRMGFNYTSLYSNGTIVNNYLVRLPPFTLYFLNFQGGRFDEPARTFQSLEVSYKLVTENTTADFKEAIPEMYYLPEMFMNAEQFDLNRQQTGSEVNNVELPPWAMVGYYFCARRFVTYHRAALESEHVTRNLPAWIDLVFGYKQAGQESVAAVNVYHPSAYPEYEAVEHNKELWSAMRRMYGVVPKQLFPNGPHPKADPRREQRPLPFLELLAPSATVHGVQWANFAFFQRLNGRCIVKPAAFQLPKNTVLVRTSNDKILGIPSGTLLLQDGKFLPC